jgi:hypothetical protein
MLKFGTIAPTMLISASAAYQTKRDIQVIDIHRATIPWPEEAGAARDRASQARSCQAESWTRRPKKAAAYFAKESTWSSVSLRSTGDLFDEPFGQRLDNAAMESFFSSLRTERIRRKTYRTRDEARADVFDYIERFYNPKRRHWTIGYLSPMEFESQVGSA